MPRKPRPPRKPGPARGPASYIVDQTPAQRRRTRRIIEEEEADIPVVRAMIRAATARMTRIDQLTESLVDHRKVKGMSAADVARATGMQRSNVSRLEGTVGKDPNPTLAMLLAYGEAIGVEVRVALIDADSGEAIESRIKPQPDADAA